MRNLLLPALCRGAYQAWQHFTQPAPSAEPCLAVHGRDCHGYILATRRQLLR